MELLLFALKGLIEDIQEPQPAERAVIQKMFATTEQIHFDLRAISHRTKISLSRLREIDCALLAMEENQRRHAQGLPSLVLSIPNPKRDLIIFCLRIGYGLDVIISLLSVSERKIYIHLIEKAREDLTLENIGEIFNVTSERIRQIQKKMRRKIALTMRDIYFHYLQQGSHVPDWKEIQRTLGTSAESWDELIEKSEKKGKKSKKLSEVSLGHVVERKGDGESSDIFVAATKTIPAIGVMVNHTEQWGVGTVKEIQGENVVIDFNGNKTTCTFYWPDKYRDFHIRESRQDTTKSALPREKQAQLPRAKLVYFDRVVTQQGVNALARLTPLERKYVLLITNRNEQGERTSPGFRKIKEMQRVLKNEMPEELRRDAVEMLGEEISRIKIFMMEREIMRKLQGTLPRYSIKPSALSASGHSPTSLSRQYPLHFRRPAQRHKIPFIGAVLFYKNKRAGKVVEIKGNTVVVQFEDALAPESFEWEKDSWYFWEVVVMPQAAVSGQQAGISEAQPAGNEKACDPVKELKSLIEEQRQAKEAELKRRAELERRAKLERQAREAELKRQAEFQRQAKEAELKRLAELERQAKLERQAREAELKRQAEERKRLAQERRDAQEEEFLAALRATSGNRNQATADKERPGQQAPKCKSPVKKQQEIMKTKTPEIEFLTIKERIARESFRALIACNGNGAEAAQLLGIKLRTFNGWIKDILYKSGTHCCLSNETRMRLVREALRLKGVSCDNITPASIQTINAIKQQAAREALIIAERQRQAKLERQAREAELKRQAEERKRLAQERRDAQEKELLQKVHLEQSRAEEQARIELKEKQREVLSALKQARDNQTQAAKLLGTTQATLSHMIVRLRIRDEFLKIKKEAQQQAERQHEADEQHQVEQAPQQRDVDFFAAVQQALDTFAAGRRGKEATEQQQTQPIRALLEKLAHPETITQDDTALLLALLRDGSIEKALDALGDDWLMEKGLVTPFKQFLRFISEASEKMERASLQSVVLPAASKPDSSNEKTAAQDELASGDLLATKIISESSKDQQRASDTIEQQVQEILAALREAEGNQTKAAALLGWNKSAWWMRTLRLGIKSEVDAIALEFYRKRLEKKKARSATDRPIKRHEALRAALEESGGDVRQAAQKLGWQYTEVVFWKKRWFDGLSFSPVDTIEDTVYDDGVRVAQEEKDTASAEDVPSVVLSEQAPEKTAGVVRPVETTDDAAIRRAICLQPNNPQSNTSEASPQTVTAHGNHHAKAELKHRLQRKAHEHESGIGNRMEQLRAALQIGKHNTIRHLLAILKPKAEKAQKKGNPNEELEKLLKRAERFLSSSSPIKPEDMRAQKRKTFNFSPEKPIRIHTIEDLYAITPLRRGAIVIDTHMRWLDEALYQQILEYLSQMLEANDQYWISSAFAPTYIGASAGCHQMSSFAKASEDYPSKLQRRRMSSVVDSRRLPAGKAGITPPLAFCKNAAGSHIGFPGTLVCGVPFAIALREILKNAKVHGNEWRQHEDIVIRWDMHDDRLIISVEDQGGSRENVEKLLERVKTPRDIAQHKIQEITLRLQDDIGWQMDGEREPVSGRGIGVYLALVHSDALEVRTQQNELGDYISTTVFLSKYFFNYAHLIHP